MELFVTVLIAVILGNVLSQLLFALVGDKEFAGFCKRSLRYSIVAGSVLAIGVLAALTVFLFDNEVGLKVFGKETLSLFDSLTVGW